jgi:hypothetical protein
LKFVPRHTPSNGLHELLEIKSLTDSFAGAAAVSPSKSACTDTEVRVDVNFGDLLRRMKKEIMEEVNHTKALVHDPIAQTSYVVRCGKYASLRNIED